MNDPTISSVSSSIIELTNDEKDLFTFIECNDIDSLKSLLERCCCSTTPTVFNINCYNTNGLTPLMIAAAAQQNNEITLKDIIPLLLKYNANVNISSNDKDKRISLHYAVDTGSYDTVCLLLPHITNINAIDQTKYENTALHIACKKYRIDIIQAILEINNDININCLDYWGLTPLHCIIQAGIQKNKIDIMHPINLLLQYGADVTVPNEWEATPFFQAVYDITIKSNERSTDNNNPILLDIEKELIQLLYESKNDVINIPLGVPDGFDSDYGRCDNYDTPLHCAIKYTNIPMTRFLLSLGASVTISNDNGFTPFYQLIFDICKYSADLNVIPDDEMVLFQLLVSTSDINMKLKLCDGAEMQSYETLYHLYGLLYTNDTPYHCAIKYKHKTLQRLLLDNGARITTNRTKRPRDP